MAELIVTILGCGSSGGVPRIGGHWGNCDSANPKNRRRRCSVLVEKKADAGTTRVLIDTAPDLREQLLDAGVGDLDAVAYTHAHADHVHGIDDLRMVVFNTGRRLAVWADAATGEALLSRFRYAFVQPEGSPYAPILILNNITGPFTVTGAGGPIEMKPFAVDHGTMQALGFRVAGVAYLPDVARMTEAAWAAIDGLDCWILDALRRKPHPTHSHLAQSLGWIARAHPRHAVLTNMHNDLDYATMAAETPDNVTPAFDGMQLRFQV